MAAEKCIPFIRIHAPSSMTLFNFITTHIIILPVIYFPLQGVSERSHILNAPIVYLINAPPISEVGGNSSPGLPNREICFCFVSCSCRACVRAGEAKLRGRVGRVSPLRWWLGWQHFRRLRLLLRRLRISPWRFSW